MISKVQGPILVLGASGFVGANLLRALVSVREDVVGTTTRFPAWRLEGLPDKCVRAVDLLVESNLDLLLDATAARTVFDCVAYGAYSFERDSALIYKTNFLLKSQLVSRLHARKIACYVHAGSSSEYGDSAAAPAEVAFPEPNSDYSVSKVATANLLYYYGKKRKLPCANLRLYSVFGPLEDSSRLMPAIIKNGLELSYPDLVNPSISRDFVYIDDVVDAFVSTAIHLTEAQYGESFNIGSGKCTAIGELAKVAKEIFEIPTEPRVHDAEPGLGCDRLVRGQLRKPLSICIGRRKRRWRKAFARCPNGTRVSKTRNDTTSPPKQNALDTKHSVTAIIACYKDGQAISIMYERLKATFLQLGR